jgi:hypothetical protein
VTNSQTGTSGAQSGSASSELPGGYGSNDPDKAYGRFRGPSRGQAPPCLRLFSTRPPHRGESLMHAQAGAVLGLVKSPWRSSAGKAGPFRRPCERSLATCPKSPTTCPYMRVCNQLA